MLSSFDYKNMWEQFYEKYGNYWSAFDVRKANDVEYRYIGELMDKFARDYIKRNKDKIGYHDVEEFYKEE